MAVKLESAPANTRHGRSCRAKASERWERRQRALPTPGQVILGFAAHYADISTLDETGMEETRFDIEQEIAREKGIPDDRKHAHPELGTP